MQKFSRTIEFPIPEVGVLSLKIFIQEIEEVETVVDILERFIIVGNSRMKIEGDKTELINQLNSSPEYKITGIL